LIVEEHGWEFEDETYKFKWFSGPQMPESVREVVIENEADNECDIIESESDEDDECDDINESEKNDEIFKVFLNFFFLSEKSFENFWKKIMV
jgi:hypothetical protein